MHPFHHALLGVKALALAAVIAVPVTAAVVADADHDTPHGSVTAALARSITAPAASMPDGCHGPGALILLDGRIREVGLARGLRAYEHKAPGSFVKLCGATPQGS